MQYKLINDKKMTENQRMQAVSVAEKGREYLKALREYIDDMCVWEIKDEEMANQISTELDKSERDAMESVYLALLAAGVVDEDDPIFELLTEKSFDDKGNIIDVTECSTPDPNEETQVIKTMGAEDPPAPKGELISVNGVPCTNGIPCTPPPLPEWYKRATASGSNTESAFDSKCEEQAKELLLPASVRPPIETGVGPKLELPPGDKPIPQWIRENALGDRAREKDEQPSKRPPIPCVGDDIGLYTEDDLIQAENEAVMRAYHGNDWQHNACSFDG